MSVNTRRLEGNGFSKLAETIRQVGYNEDVTIMLAEVLAPLPDIRLKAQGITFELEKDDVVLAEHLTTHERTMTIKNGSVSGQTTTNGDPSHSHGITDVSITQADVTIESNVQIGDHVIVFFNGSDFYVIDKAVI